MSLVSAGGRAHSQGEEAPRCEWAHEGFGITFMSEGLGVEVLKRERDVITDVDTVIAVVTSIAKGFAKAKLL